MDPSTMDLSVKPQDNFYLYANGTWLKNNTIPAQYTWWGTAPILRDKNVENLNKLCIAAAAKGAAGSPAERVVGDYYSSGMDEAAVNAAGFAPLQTELDRIKALAGPADILLEIGHLHALGVTPGFQFGSGADSKDSGMDIAQMEQGGLGLPDRDYYINDDDKSKKIREEYLAHVSKTLQLLGDSPDVAGQEAAAIMSLESALATASTSREVLRNPYSRYHKMPVADLAKFTGDLDWKAYYAAVGAPAFEQVNLAEPDFFKAFSERLHSTSVADWQSYLRWHLANGFSPYMSDPFVQENYHFNGQVLSGTKEMRSRWKRVVGEVDGDAGDLLAQLYVEQYFPPEAKARMIELIDNLKAALREDIASLTWMDEPTKAKAVEKLNALGVKVGYPDKWRDYTGLVIDRGPYVQNVMRAQAFEVRRQLNKIGKPVDKTEWYMTAPTFNAYYAPSKNEIVFPAGILQPPVFGLGYDDASNYGSIGSVIGHEMTHGFDDHGRQYDAHGNLADWWSTASANNYKVRSDAIVKEFNDYTVLDGLHVMGQRTQGENIADLGGLKISYIAMEKALAGKPRPLIDGFTPEQRFFISYASYYRALVRPESRRLRIQADPHSPEEFRTNGPLSNSPAFFDAFNVPEGAPMRRPAADLIQIW
ncbi:MAG TPA: M13 family metallopeptidase [Opitutaceae bacterium]|nr:M13 family metallopeptidase [Opitutaceae bacterium]